MSNTSSSTSASASTSGSGEGLARPDRSRARRVLSVAREKLPTDRRPVPPVGRARPTLRRVADAAAWPARATAFWAAVTLPFLQVAFLVRGLSTPAETRTFAVLLAANLLALLVGHSYRR